MINKNDNLHEVHIEIKLTIPLIRGEKDCKVIKKIKNKNNN